MKNLRKLLFFLNILCSLAALIFLLASLFNSAEQQKLFMTEYDQLRKWVTSNDSQKAILSYLGLLPDAPGILASWMVLLQFNQWLQNIQVHLSNEIFLKLLWGMTFNVPVFVSLLSFTLWSLYFASRKWYIPLTGLFIAITFIFIGSIHYSKQLKNLGIYQCAVQTGENKCAFPNNTIVYFKESLSRVEILSPAHVVVSPEEVLKAF